MNKKIENILLVFIIYTIGVFLGLIFCLLRALGRIKIMHPERIPCNQGNLVLVSNHPSLLEPILLPFLFFQDYLLHPIKLSPWSVPDKKNYFDKWYWVWAKLRMVPVERGNRWQEARCFNRIRKILTQERGIFIIFPEGGRTSNGDKFLFSKKGKKIRLLKEGIGLLVLKTDSLVLPVWVNNTEDVLPNAEDERLYWIFPRFWKKASIKIGMPFRISCEHRDEATGRIAEALLSLADQE